MIACSIFLWHWSCGEMIDISDRFKLQVNDFTTGHGSIWTWCAYLCCLLWSFHDKRTSSDWDVFSLSGLVSTVLVSPPTDTFQLPALEMMADLSEFVDPILCWKHLFLWHPFSNYFLCWYSQPTFNDRRYTDAKLYLCNIWSKDGRGCIENNGDHFGFRVSGAAYMFSLCPSTMTSVGLYFPAPSTEPRSSSPDPTIC